LIYVITEGVSLSIYYNEIKFKNQFTITTKKVSTKRIKVYHFFSRQKHGDPKRITYVI